MLFVQASLLAIHVSGQPSAPVSHWARINTPVEVLDEQGEMLKVTLLDRPNEHPVTGWVHVGYLDAEPITVKQALGRIQHAKHDLEDEAAVEMWTDRRNALRPQYIGQPDPVAHIAYCDSDRAVLMGQVDADRGFSRTAHTSELTVPLRSLSTLNWMVIRDDALETVQGSPFVQPFTTGTWNEEGRSAYAPGSCDGICDEEAFNIVLGPCDDPGAVLVSSTAARPMAPVQDRVEVVDNVGLWLVERADMEIKVRARFGSHYSPDVVAIEPSRQWVRVGTRRWAFLSKGADNYNGIGVYEVTDEGVLENAYIRLHGSGC